MPTITNDTAANLVARYVFKSLEYNERLRVAESRDIDRVVNTFLSIERNKQMVMPLFAADSADSDIAELLEQIKEHDCKDSLSELWEAFADPRFSAFADYMRTNHGIEIFQCDDCGEICFSEESHTTVNGNVCESCREEYFTCDHCEDLHHVDNAVGVHDGDTICDSCYSSHYFTCDGCSEVFSDDDANHVYGATLCDSCYGENYSPCVECGDAVHHEDSLYTEESSDGRSGYVCQCCQSEYEYSDDACEYVHQSHATPRGVGRIYDYHQYKAENLSEAFSLGKGEKKRIRKGKDRTRYYGIELEIERKPGEDLRDVAEETGESLEDFAILMKDGSIENPGFEIVAAPATMAYQYKRWNDYFDGPAKRSLGFNTSECGMHVNVSRASMTPLTQFKVLYFINRPDSHEMVIKQAHRRPGRYWRFENDDTSTICDKAKRGDQSREKFVAVNTRKNAVLEFRMFKSTVNKDGFFQRLESVDSWVAFCECTSATSLNAENYYRFMSRNESRKRWTYLCKWMERKELIPPRKVKAKA